MFKLIAYALALVALLGLAACANIGAASHPNIVQSVRPIQLEGFGTVCTAFSVSELKHLWMTAGHCAIDNITLGGSDIDLVGFSKDDDLAVFHAEFASAPGLNLANEGPTYLAPLFAMGYPYGEGPLMSMGYLMAPAIESDGGGTFMRFAMPGCPGNSGSPIVNYDGDLVSVWQVGFGLQGQCGSVNGGVTFDKLSAFLLPLLVQ